MASIIRRPNNHKWIQFKGVDGKRRTLRLGKLTEDQAATIKEYVVALLNAKRFNIQPSELALLWLSKVDESFKKRLSAVGLCDYTPPLSVAALAREYLDAQTFADSTRKNVENSVRNFKTFFGDNYPVANINAADADRFMVFIVNKGGKRGTPVSPATASRRFRHIKTILDFAAKSKAIPESPFANYKTGREVNRSRQHYVEISTIELVMQSVDSEFAAMLALMRYGGFRVCEVQSFTWGAVNWEAGIVRVDSSKTGVRSTPLFSPLRHWLERADTTATPAFPSYQGMSNGFWAKRMRAALKGCGVAIWPRLFQNLRASRATELRDNGAPGAVAASWFGHSEGIADRHYVQTADHHHRKAVAGEYESECKTRSTHHA